MPISIENEMYEFDLLVTTVAAGTVEPEFDLFLEVNNSMVVMPVKFSIVVEPKQEEAEPPPPENEPTENEPAGRQAQE